VGYAENYGGRYLLTQRVVWDGPWKLAWNGFDFDELYNLDNDPYEMRNLAEDPAYQPQLRRLMQTAWRKVRDTGDAPLLHSTYPLLRLAPYGPEILNG
jgi:choline-sulfatase